MRVNDYCLLLPDPTSGLEYIIPVHPELSRFWSKDFILLKDDVLVPVVVDTFGKYSDYQACLYDRTFNYYRSAFLIHNSISAQLSISELIRNSKASMFRPVKPSCLCIVIDDFPRYIEPPMYLWRGAYYLDITIYTILLFNVFYSLFNVHDLMNEFIKIYINHICLSPNTTFGIANEGISVSNYTYRNLYNEYTVKFNENINLRDIQYNNPSLSDIKAEFDLSLNKFRSNSPIEISDPEYVIILNYSYYNHENDLNITSIIDGLNLYISQILPNTTIINENFIGNLFKGVQITDLKAYYHPVSKSGFLENIQGFRIVRPWPIAVYNSLLKIY